MARRDSVRRVGKGEQVGLLVDEVQIEATFRDGRKLVTLHEPIQ